MGDDKEKGAPTMLLSTKRSETRIMRVAMALAWADLESSEQYKRRAEAMRLIDLLAVVKP